MNKIPDLWHMQGFFKKLTLLVGISAVLCSLYISHVVNKEMVINFDGELQDKGYGLENHTVISSDGYILTHHRILPKNRDTSNRKVVILVHGMMGKSWLWICLGAHNSLAYNLLDDGYDTWLLNLRGNSFSSKHENISSHSGDYWQYTWDDIGKYDLPASIDYILQVTGEKSLKYIGFSMGATIFFVLISERPEYAIKISKMVALAPAVYDVNVLRSYPNMYYLSRLLAEISEYTNIRSKMYSGYTCNNGWDVICAFLMKDRFEKYDPNINQAKLDEIMHFSMDTGSMLLVSHFHQNYKSGKFMKFNYGRKMNAEIYGSEVPPEYNLTSMHVPVSIFYSTYDETCSPAGIERLSRDLPNVENSHKITSREFSHSSFYMSSSAKELVNDKILLYFDATSHP